MSKEIILSNLRLLRSAVEAQPEQLFDLARFKKEEPCGTLFCTAGLAASMPEFQAQGMHFESQAHPLFRSSSARWRVKIGESYLWDEGGDTSTSTDNLFGEESSNTLFTERYEGACDADILRDDDGGAIPGISDKQLALMRLDVQIEFMELS